MTDHSNYLETLMRSRPYDVRRRLSRLIVSAVLMSIGGQMTGVHAANMPSAIVRYDEHDLAGDASAQRLLQRIESAAQAVCFEETREPLPMQQAARRCALAAVAHAVDTIGASKLTAAYVTKYGPQARSTEARQNRVPSVQPIKRS